MNKLLIVGALALVGCDPEVLAPAPAPRCYDRQVFTEQELCVAFPDACAPAADAPPTFSEPITVVPDAQAMPEGVVSQVSHNNLDIVWHHGRLFFAFRTAPTHFASSEVVMYVVSTTDQKTWQLEASFAMGKDLREPRFLTLGDRLLLYFARLGEKKLTFTPEAMLMSEQLDGCVWSTPKEVVPVAGGAPFIPWRAREIDGVGHLIGYAGGDEIYDFNEGGIPVHWLTTNDGETFAPAVGDDSVVLQGGTSETDFAFLDDGTLVAVSRNEAGDAEGFGSKICRAEANDLGNWTCQHDPRKYDSPLVFAHRGQIYLIGRRQVANDGLFDLGYDELPPADQAQKYQIAYWGTPKRCSLWRVDADSLTVDLLLDLPSNGDTCFASALPLDQDQVLIYNYTSPLDDPDLAWSAGQVGNTYIYRTTLTLP